MAAITHVGSIKKHFAKLRDPRVRGRTQHRLIDIIVMAICAVIGNCDDWPDIALFAQKRQSWFKRFLALPNGVPAHDTFERVFALLDPRAFERCCLAWLRAAADQIGVGHIAIDGKTLCGSASAKLGPLHLVSAWATQANLSLGQVAVDRKSNEITAIPQLLALLDLKGALVTIDAIGCQKEIARHIVAAGADYVLTVKANQEHLLEDIQTTVEKALDGELPAPVVEEYTTTRANASNLLHSRGAGQGFRKKIGVQGGSFAFAGDAVFPRMLLEQAQRHFAHQGEVLSRVTVLDATLILTEADIQLPM